MIKKQMLIKFYYSILLFYFIYTPEFFLVIDIPLSSHIIVVFFFGYIFINLLFKISFTKKIKFFANKRVKTLFIGILLATFYFTIVAILSDNKLRIFQNLYIIPQTIVVIYFFDRLSRFGLGKFEKLEILYRIAAIQGIFSIWMLFSPSFRQLALNLYYLDRPKNMFISTMRIYGVSGEYTFFTPIFHGLLIVVAVYLFLYESKKFIIYIPFIFISIFLNGRTGLLVAIIGIIITLAWYSFIHFEKIYKIALILILFCLSIYLILIFIKAFLSPTYLWIMSAGNEILNFFNEGNTGGTLEVLSNMFVLPEGFKLMFGEGFRLYGNTKGLIHSDIGYVNDLFMGGLIYCLILYSFEINYIFTYDYIKEISKKITLSSILFFVLAISNYKGESARMGLVLLGVILIKYLLDQPDKASDLKGEYM